MDNDTVEEAASDVESVYQEPDLKRDVIEPLVDERMRQEVHEVMDVEKMKEEEERKVKKMKEEEERQMMDEAIVKRLEEYGFADTVIPFLPLIMTPMNKNPVNNHWSFDKWDCDEECSFFFTKVKGMTYNTVVHDVKRVITSPLFPEKTPDSLTVVYGGKEYYFNPEAFNPHRNPKVSCSQLRKYIKQVQLQQVMLCIGSIELRLPHLHLFQFCLLS